MEAFLHLQAAIPGEQTAEQSTSSEPLVIPALTVAFERLLDEDNPQDQLLAFEMRQARRLCGRWLALRRLCLGLTNKLAMLHTGLDEQTLLLLEAGLADPSHISEATRIQLSQVFAPTPADEGWVRGI